MEKKRRNIFLLGLTSFVNDVSSKLIMPILPLFIASLGGKGIALGLISGVGAFMAAFFKIISGYWSDKRGKRKGWVFSGYLTSAIAKLLLSFSSVWGEVLLFRGADRLGKGLRSAPRDALLATSTTKKRRGKGFGIHRAFDSGGAVLGAILVFFLFYYFGFSFRHIFVLAGLLGLASVLPLAGVKEKVIKKKIKAFKLSWKGLDFKLKLFIMVAGLFALGNFSYMFFVLKTQEFFGPKWIMGAPILFYALYQISYSSFSIPVGILSDKIGRGKILFFGYGLFSLICLGFLRANSAYWFILLFLLYGIMFALVNATERAYVSDLSSERVRGTALGTYYFVTSLVVLPGGLLAGYLWDLNKNFTFGYGFIISLLTLFLFYGVMKKKKTPLNL